VPRSPPRRSALNRGFGWAVGISVVVHAAGIGAVVYAQSRSRSRPELSKAIPVQLVRLGKPRDPKLLPRKVRPPPPGPKDAPAPPEPKSKPREGPNVALDRTPPEKTKRKRRATDPELSDAAKRLLQSGAERELDEAIERIETPEGSPLGAPEGTTSDPQGAVDAYTVEVQRRLQAQYKIPKTIPSAQRPFLEAEVILYINRDGSVRRFEFVKRHPNEQFTSALEALLRTIEFPSPPKERARELATEGLPIRFRP